jgi:hypothetical protein
MHLLVRHATGRGGTPLSATVGQSISVPLPRKHGTRAQVTWPGGKSDDYLVEAGQRELALEKLALHGNVVVTIDQAPAAGFAVNVDPKESQRERIAKADLLAGFAPGAYVRVAPSLDELERRTDDRRGSVDLYPFLIALLFLFFLGEAVYANRV